MPEYDNASIAIILDDFSDLLEIAGADRYRTLSYHKAAHAVRAWDDDITRTALEGRLTEIPGVGAKLAATISSLIARGTFPELEEVKATLPQSITELMRVPGLGPKRAKALYDELGIGSADDLEAALSAGRLDEMPGFGSKTIEAVRAGLVRYRENAAHILLADALPLAERLVASLEAVPSVHSASYAGSIRRMRETVSGVDVLVATDDPSAVVEAVRTLPGVTEMLDSGHGSARVMTTSGRQAMVRITTCESWGAALQHYTGSEAHTGRLREIAAARGLTIGQDGVFDGSGSRVAGGTEESVYSALGMLPVPPEIREDAGEIELALSGTLPSLVTLADIRGDLHSHTTATDGKSSIERNRARAAELGYEYLGCSDHAYDLRMVGGLDLVQLEEQWALIDELNARGDGPVLLKSIELNINDEGGVDYPDEVLARFDYCIASLHHGFGQPREKATGRVLAAMENPYVDIIGHLTGRLLGRRDPIDLDVAAIVAKAAETGTILELNSHPERLDLNAEHLRMAKNAGVGVCIDTDAHDVTHFNFLRWGVATARRGWISPVDVLNAQPLAVLRSRLKRSRANVVGR